MMKQKQGAFICSFLLPLLAAISGCGIMGSKDPYARKLAVTEKDPGCLDGLGSLMTRFADGAVAQTEWDRAFNCLDDTLNTFSKFVKESDPNGFNHADIKALIENFLITKNPITDDLVSGFFDLKASFFGGNGRVLTKAELAEVRSLLKFLQLESVALIPHLKNRRENPTEDNLRAFIVASKTFGNRLADFLKSSNFIVFPQESVIKLMRELAGTTAESMTPDEMQAWTETVLGIKYALVGGAEFGISGQDWKELIRYGVSLGATLWSFTSIEENPSNPLFEIELAQKAQTLLNQSVNQWNGSIPVSIFERIAKVVPASFLDQLGHRTEELRGALQAILKPRLHCPNEAPIVNGRCSKTLTEGAGQGDAPVNKRAGLLTLLGSQSLTGFDKNAFQTLVNFYTKGKRADYHVVKIFGTTTGNVTADTFVSMANQYKTTLRDQASKDSVERLKLIATRYRGLFPKNGKQITFGSQAQHSLTNIKEMSWYELMATTLLRGYGKTTGNAVEVGESTPVPLGSVDDLFVLVQDFNPVLIALSMVHPDKREVHKKRFREANLFMPSGDGSLNMGLKETTEYFAFLFSSSRLSREIKNDILRSKDGKTGICNEVGFDDKLKIPTYDIDCFRREYIARYPTYFRNMPGMFNELNAMTPSQRANFNRSIEASSKLFGYDNSPISAFDVDSYGGIPHFVEGVMQKYDTRNGGPDGFLDWKEVNNDVFPIFKNELTLISGFDIPLVNRAILIWLMQKGESPLACKKPTIKEIWNIVKWLFALGPMDNFKAPRMRVYDIFEALSKPACPQDVAQSAMNQSGTQTTDPTANMTQAEVKVWIESQPEYKQLLEIFPQDK
jgi:hypothetical protein